MWGALECHAHNIVMSTIAPICVGGVGRGLIRVHIVLRFPEHTPRSVVRPFARGLPREPEPFLVDQPSNRVVGGELCVQIHARKVDAPLHRALSFTATLCVRSGSVLHLMISSVKVLADN